MTGPGHGRIRAVAMDGISEDASLRAPGRNERRSAGHGKRRAPRCRAAETIQGKITCDTFQRLTIPAAMAVASSGVGSGKDSPVQRQLKKKLQLGRVEPATAVVRGQDGRSKYG